MLRTIYNTVSCCTVQAVAPGHTEQENKSNCSGNEAVELSKLSRMDYGLCFTSTVKPVDATLLACDNKDTQRKFGNLLNGRQGGVVQANRSLLTIRR